MGNAAMTERDELLYGQVKGDRVIHLGLAVTYAAVALGAVGLGIAIVVSEKGLANLIFAFGMGVGAAGSAAYEWAQFKAYVAALDEIGDDPAGVDSCKTFSPRTASIIAESRKTVRELRQLWIAYGIMAIMLLGFTAMFAILSLDPDFGNDVGIFYFTGAVMAAMGFPLLILAIKAFREWTLTRRLEKLK